MYSMWYNVRRLLSVGVLEWGGTDYVFGESEHIVRVAALQASDRHQSGNIIPHAVHHSLALLRMGKELPETC